MLAGTFFYTGLGLGLGFLEEDLDSDLDLPTYGGLGLGLGLEYSGLGLALGLGCCWTCYKSARCRVATVPSRRHRNPQCYSTVNSLCSYLCHIVLSRSFKPRFRNASLAQWARLPYILDLIDRRIDSQSRSYFFSHFSSFSHFSTFE